MKNLSLIREFVRNLLQEGVIKIPEFDDLDDPSKVSEIMKYTLRDIYDEIQTFVDFYDGIENIKPSYGLMIMPKAFQIKNHDGDKVISVNFTGYKARPDDLRRKQANALFVAPDTVSFNLEKIKNMSLDKFKQTLFHELAHLKDPYLQKSPAFVRSYDISTDNELEDFEKYSSRQEEYTAQMSAYVNEFNSWIKKYPDAFSLVQKLIEKLISSPSKEFLSFELIFDEEKFSEIFGDQFKYWEWLEDFFDWAKSWANNPKLKNKFLKDFYKAFEHFLAKSNVRPNLPKLKNKPLGDSPESSQKIKLKK